MKHESLWVTAIIPAKTDSTRLTKKNLKVILQFYFKNNKIIH